MDPDDDETAPALSARRYAEEDVSSTTSKELRGWYFYGIAAEAFAVCGPGSFLPVALEQLARENGVLWSDRNTPCIGAEKTASSHLLSARADAGNDQCVVNILGADITTASFAMYTFSLAVFIQALALVSFSSVADYGNNRKQLLLLFAFIGSAAGMLFIFMVPAIYLLAPLLTIIAIASLGCSFVMLNSFLPLLASNHPSVRAQEKELVPTATLVTHEIPSLPIPSVSDPPLASSTPTSAPAPALTFSNAMSARGVGLGYAAAVLVQILCILTLIVVGKYTASRTLPLRIALFIASTWWFIFTIPTFLWLRPRPGPPLPAALISAPSPTSSFLTRVRTAKTYILFAWKSIWHTLRMALSLTQLRLFLLAWFLISDAVATVGSTAIMFARTELHLSPTSIALLSITATTSGIVGSLLWPRLTLYLSTRSRSRSTSPTSPRTPSPHTTRTTILLSLLTLLLIPLYGLLSYLPPIQHLGFLGLQQPWEIFPLAVIYGVAMGGLSSYCRSFYGALVPRGREAAFFALFAITDKGSSAVGPAVVGRIVDRWGTIRPAFMFLVLLIGAPVGLVRRVDVLRGAVEAGELAARRAVVGGGAGEGEREGEGGIELVSQGRRNDAGTDRRTGDGDGDREEAEGLLRGEEGI